LAGMGPAVTRRRQPEVADQRAVIQHNAWRARPDVFAFHVPNGGWRSRVEGGRPTEAQLATIIAMEAAGAFCCIAEGLDPALAVLEAWQLLRGAL
jgi:hypothetical protein